MCTDRSTCPRVRRASQAIRYDSSGRETVENRSPRRLPSIRCVLFKRGCTRMKFVRSLTITIVNHNHWKWIQGCLESLAAHPYTLGPSEIVVLDNASEDGSVQGIQRSFPAVRLLSKSTRRGFGANQNEAVSTATTDLVFLMNPDAVVHEGTLDRLAQAFDVAESIAITACPDSGSDSSAPISSPIPFPTPVAALERALHVKRNRDRRLLGEHAVVSNGWVSGHAFMVDRRRFLEIDGFDTSFFMYSEEVDLMRRMQRRGWKIVWIEHALTSHIGKTSESATLDTNGSPSPMTTRTTVQLSRSEVKYIQKNFGCLATLAFRAASALDATIRYIATWLPWTSSRMVTKGPSVAHTRAHHLARLKVFLGDTSSPDLEDAAEAWNRANPPRA